MDEVAGLSFDVAAAGAAVGLHDDEPVRLERRRRGPGHMVERAEDRRSGFRSTMVSRCGRMATITWPGVT
jgi:hypothetical protein